MAKRFDALMLDMQICVLNGEKKQAEMMHLFALKPKFVFMDEIDSGVDKEAIKKVFNIKKSHSDQNLTSNFFFVVVVI